MRTFKALVVLIAALTLSPAAFADDALSQAFTDTLAKVPAAWRQPLQDSQIAWQATLEPSCHDEGPYLADCLQKATAARLKELKKTLLSASDRQFITIITHGMAPPNEFNEKAAPYSTALIQIAEPKTEAERLWNTAASHLVDDKKKDITGFGGDLNMALETVGLDFIGVVINVSQDTGTGGSSFISTPFEWSLRLNRPIVAKDLLKDVAKGSKAIAQLASDKNDSEPEIDLKAMRDLTKPMRYWSLGAKGLTFDFDDDNAYGAGHRVTTMDITLSWAELAPYLRKDLPFDPAKLVDVIGL